MPGDRYDPTWQGTGTWHTIELLEPNSVIFECKEGPFSRLASSNERLKVERVEHEVDGILNVEKK